MGALYQDIQMKYSSSTITPLLDPPDTAAELIENAPNRRANQFVILNIISAGSWLLVEHIPELTFCVISGKYLSNFVKASNFVDPGIISINSTWR